MIGFDVIDNWDTELKEMNKVKVSKPFRYPNTLLHILGYANTYFHGLYTNQRRIITRGHAHGNVPSIPNYTIISRRRINKLNLKLKDNGSNKESIKDDYIIIATDSISIKVTKRSQWLRDK